MFEQIKNFIITHESQAPWVIFFSIILAGLNIPISLDLMIVLVSFLAATHFAHIKTSLLLSFFFGCCLSAWVSYSLGRTLGTKVLSKFISEDKTKKIQSFLLKNGSIAFLIGRFIPFGFRNCLFMTSGFSKYPFWKFALLDFFACLIWTIASFSLFYSIGTSLENLQSHLKIINITIFTALSVTLIAFFCYKYKKRIREE